MKIIKPETLKTFIREFEKYNSPKQCYFRGQADYSWEIVPGIARNKNIKNIDSLLKIEKNLLEKLDKKIIEKNKEQMIQIIDGSYHNTWKLVMAAQHYGLPTRLIDFSHDKYTALEFAIGDLQHLAKDGALIIYENVDFVQENPDSSRFSEAFNDSYNSFFLQVPKLWGHSGQHLLSERRKQIQGSKFFYVENENLFQSLSLNKVHSKNLVIIHISSRIKPSLVDYLIDHGKMAYDLYAGRNELDYYAAAIKNEFNRLTPLD
jgi:hypothetical protein